MRSLIQSLYLNWITFLHYLKQREHSSEEKPPIQYIGDPREIYLA